MNSGERIETLTRLGLTLNQARAYLALVQFGPICAKELAETSKITRQDIYRVTVELEEKGFVEKLIFTPTVYRACPIEMVTSYLVNRKVAEHEEMQEKTQQLVIDVQRSYAMSGKSLQDEVSQFVMIAGKDTIIHRFVDALSKASKNLDVVTSHERFSPAIESFAKEYRKALARGVKIRIAVEKHVAENSALEITRNLAINQNFDLRFFSCAPEAVVSIFDGKEASITISKTANFAKTSALWSNDTSFVALARSYFENKWKNSTRPSQML